jgi:hypothetical protein
LTATAATITILAIGAGARVGSANAASVIPAANSGGVGPLAASTAALTLPAGFRLVDYPTGQSAYNLTNFAWLDDGGLLTSGKNGTITFLPPGGQRPAWWVRCRP